MRMFGVAVIVIIGVSVGAYFALGTLQQPVGVAFSTGGARPDLAEE
jgi:hypothetical protein